MNRKLLVHTSRPVVANEQPGQFAGLDLGVLEFKTLLTAEAFEISQKMIAQVYEICNKREIIHRRESQMIDQNLLGRPAMNFTQFQVWLDLNPYIRTLIIQSINPEMWA